MTVLNIFKNHTKKNNKLKGILWWSCYNLLNSILTILLRINFIHFTSNTSITKERWMSYMRLFTNDTCNRNRIYIFRFNLKNVEQLPVVFWLIYIVHTIIVNTLTGLYWDEVYPIYRVLSKYFWQGKHL